MKLEKAYSYELKKDITPVEADIQFQRGTICSKFNFRCPDKTCKAQVTCANLDRPKRLRKRNPYYKVVGEHSNDCLIAKNIEKQPDRRKNYDIYGQEDEPIENAFRINLQPPITKKNESSDIDSSTRKTPSNSELNGNQTSHSKRQPQPEKTLSSLVDSFLNNETISIQLPTIGSISIQKLFLEINKQDIATLPDEWRIYHGQAWINKKDNGYSIVFKKRINLR